MRGGGRTASNGCADRGEITAITSRGIDALILFRILVPSVACGYSTLKITDGTTTADLTDQTNYQLVDGGWAPSVAPLRKSTLGGSGPYEDVIEEIVVNVHGTTAATCLANLAKLSQLLDQAERWSRGENISPVKLQCQPWGSSYLASAVCDSGPGNE